MPRPYKHPKTGVYWLRQRVPADIRAVAKGKPAFIEIDGRSAPYTLGAELKVSLRTKDPREAKERARSVEAQSSQIWDTFRNRAPRLSFKNMVALSGELYQQTVRRHEDNPGPPQFWEFLDQFTGELMALAETDPEAGMTLLVEFARSFGINLPEGPLMAPDLQRILQSRSVALQDDDRLEQLAQAIDAQRASFKRLARNAKGDYGPDPKAQQFPSFTPPDRAEPQVPAAPGLSLFVLLDHKKKTRTLKPKTVSDYRRLLREFVDFVGHDDATRLTRADVRRWRDKLIMEVGAPKKTVNDRYLAALKSVLNHGVKEFDLTSNVADGIRDERDDAAPAGAKDYTLEQARTILAATFKGTSKDVELPYKRALFWVPWLCAYTGARVTEITQLQAERLLEQDGVPYLLVTPQDGSTKSGKAWLVGIHKHLIDLGLLDMIKAVGSGPLFYAPYPAGTDLTKLSRHRASDSAKRVTDWIGGVLGESAPLGRPNHAWRHTFTTLSRVANMDKEARDFMMGSRSTTDAREGYGQWPPVVLDREINKLPRFQVPETDWRPPTAQVPPKAIRDASASGRRTMRRDKRSKRGR